MSSPISIHWFRQDLRLSDNPALCDAAQSGKVLPIYVLDDINAGEYAMGAASRVWLHHSLVSLNKSLNGGLCVYQGDPLQVLQQLIRDYSITSVHWNRCYEPWRMERDTVIKKTLQACGIEVHSHNGSLLWEPWTIQKKDGTPYKVFTPFYRKGCLLSEAPRQPLDIPELSLMQDTKHAVTIADLGLLPNLPWGKTMMDEWIVGEAAAQERIDDFLESGVENYKEGRNFPAKQHVSRLSPHLHFGELSPHQAWYAARASEENDQVDCFCSELGWREFSYSQLTFHHDLPKKNLQKKFDAFPWKTNDAHLRAWQQGRTGIPIVDAGMRELWETGYMHNRVRMIVGSFLVKNLLLDWREGERWFWECLLDADLANNSASWQWVAGCGADAAPYFRVFNPVTQGEKFDGRGEYTRRFVPELKTLPDKWLFRPWEAPDDILKEAGIVLGETYPEPIVDIKASRQLALYAFTSLKKL